MAVALRIAALRGSTRGLRAFSLSCPRQKNSIGPLPTFAATSSQDLDCLLAHLRKEMFINPHLLERQRLLTHKKKNHPLLEEDPIYFPIGSQTVQLTPKLVTHHFPRKMFTKALQMMNDPKDFDAVPGLVLGYTQGGLELLDKHLAMAVRRAGLTGRADVLLRILEQAQYNNILISAEIAREGFRGFTVTAKLPSKRAVIKAVRGARHLRSLLGKQDNLALGRYNSAASVLSEAGKTQTGVEAELGPKPVPVAKDPVGLGTLAGVTSEASWRFNGKLDHGGYTARYVRQMLSPESWGIIKQELGGQWEPVYTLNDGTATREAFHNRRATITSLSVLIDSLKSAEGVLSKTANYISTTSAPEMDTSLFNPKHGLTEKNIKDHGLEVGKLAKRLRMEIPVMEQLLGKWVQVMVVDGAKVMRWSEEETRLRMEGTGKKYEWAAGELAKRGVEGVGEDVEEVYKEAKRGRDGIVM
ncbi:hypothetical protein EV426DRAFT_580123 [Tirmania nivea]|nr:hypothetical protein EV426DRAFT_580123 [Tirmania nivea]